MLDDFKVPSKPPHVWQVKHSQTIILTLLIATSHQNPSQMARKPQCHSFHRFYLHHSHPFRAKFTRGIIVPPAATTPRRKSDQAPRVVIGSDLRPAHRAQKIQGSPWFNDVGWPGVARRVKGNLWKLRMVRI